MNDSIGALVISITALMIGGGTIYYLFSYLQSISEDVRVIIKRLDIIESCLRKLVDKEERK